MAHDSLPAQFGSIDIYVFDQLLKGRISARDRVLDAGCGTGRNIHYLLRQGFDVTVTDVEPRAVAACVALAEELGQPIPASQALVAGLDALPFDREAFDVVLCNTVLHFARDDAQFEHWVHELFRVLRPGGLFFARLAGADGIADQVRWLDGRRAVLPDGSERYLIDHAQLQRVTEQYGDLLDPLKTTIVHGQRAMTTWVVRKRTATG
jgi:tellurite methyltransferase